MNVFIMFCCSSKDDSILSIHGVYKDEQEVIEHCANLNAMVIKLAVGYYFDYKTTVLL